MKQDLKVRNKILRLPYFSLLLGLALFFLFLGFLHISSIFTRLERRLLDLHFNLKTRNVEKNQQEGVKQVERSSRISPDILIIGIDDRSLNAFGQWPFPRSRHGALLNSFSRIKRQGDREASVFLDIFFIEPARNPSEDDILTAAMNENGRVFIETVLKRRPMPPREGKVFFQREQVLHNHCGELKDVRGDTSKVIEYYGLQSPLSSYGQSCLGYGHANFYDDSDKVYRRQQLVARSRELKGVMNFDDFKKAGGLEPAAGEAFAWQDKKGVFHNISYPLNKVDWQNLEKELARKGIPEIRGGETSWKIYHYRDHYIPSITLALAARYFHKNLDELKVEIGRHVIIPSAKDGKDLVIPIDEHGQMLINYMGPRSSADRKGYQTFPVRPYAGYASRVPPENPEKWPKTKALRNKILMVGAFAQGIADDEKTTPYGLMYGVEIHANALNTIIMDNFLKPLPEYFNVLILLLSVMGMAFITSRMAPGWSFFILLLFIPAFFMATSLLFEHKNLMVPFAAPAMASLVTYMAIVLYRVVTEESDKKRIKAMFGKYVNPVVVEQMMEKPPELGGVDRDTTIFFSDIRSFTTLSETMPPQELVLLLNEYLTVMTDCILDYQGTLDKYIGDAVMCFWGAPLEQEDHALRACKCALKQLQLLEELNRNWPEHKQIHIGIGLNSGISTVGNMGSTGRMNYTIMGDNVNLASRLEGINKQYGTSLIISESTYKKIKDKGSICRELDDIQVKGKTEPVRIYELLDFEDGLELD